MGVQAFLVKCVLVRCIVSVRVLCSRRRLRRSKRAKTVRFYFYKAISTAILVCTLLVRGLAQELQSITL
jgi:hypothetical protein